MFSLLRMLECWVVVFDPVGPADHKQKDDRRDCQRGCHQEHRTHRDIGRGGTQQGSRSGIPKSGVAGVVTKPLAEAVMSAKRKGQRCDRRCHHTARERVTNLGAPDDVLRREPAQQDRGQPNDHHGTASDETLAMERIHQHTAGQLAEQASEGPNGQRQTERGLTPALLGEPDSDERPEPGLNRRDKKIQAVEGKSRSHPATPQEGPTSSRMLCIDVLRARAFAGPTAG